MRFPRLGAREEKVIDLVGHTYLGPRALTHMSWSPPDGLWLATAERSQEDEPVRIVLISPQTKEKKDLTTPPMAFLVISGLRSHRMEAKWPLFGGLLWS